MSDKDGKHEKMTVPAWFLVVFVGLIVALALSGVVGLLVRWVVSVWAAIVI